MAKDSTNPQRDFIIQRGANLVLTQHVSANLTGHSFTLVGKQSHGATTADVFSLSSLGGEITTSLQGGHTDINCAVVESLTLGFSDPAYGVYALQGTSAGVTTRYAEGTFYVVP